MSIDWLAFVVVFAASLTAAAVVVTLYALGIRFLATPAPQAQLADGTLEPTGPARDEEYDDIDEGVRPRWATVGAWICFTLSGAAAVFGVLLIVPAFHSWL